MAIDSRYKGKFGKEVEALPETTLTAISNLKAETVNFEGKAVNVLGYYAKGDGGGGLFYWDAASTEADNGGTIIQANAITTGRWKRVFSGAVNVKWFGAKGDGKDALDGNITTGTNNFTTGTAIFSATDVGKVISIKGAGTSGAYLVTTIATYVSATNVTLSTNAALTVSGVSWFFGTDDTFAIQDTINAAYADGGGKVYVNKGIHIINGILQTSVGGYAVNPNSQLWIPYYNADIQDRRTIEICGEFAATLYQGLGLAPRPAANSGTIFRSTIQGSGIEPSVICNKGGAPNDFRIFSRTNLLIKNISIQLTVNENNAVTMGGINGFDCSIINLEYVTAYPHTMNLTDSSRPPINVTGISMPKVGSEHFNSLRNCTVGGFENGYRIGEHASAYDIVAISCYTGYRIMENNHTANLLKIASFWNVNDITIDNNQDHLPSGLFFNVHQLITEWKSVGKWYDNVNTISDADNKGMGKINFDIVEANVGVNNNRFKKIGGKNIICEPISVNISSETTDVSYILKYTDAFKKNKFNGSSDQTITIPPATSVTYDIDTEIVIQRLGLGNIDIVAGAGVTLNIPTGYLAEIKNQYDAISLVQTAVNVWSVYGALTTAT